MSYSNDLNDDHYDPCFMCRRRDSEYCKAHCEYREKPEICKDCLEPLDTCICAEIDHLEELEFLRPSIPIPSSVLQAASTIDFAAMRMKEITKTLI